MQINKAALDRIRESKVTGDSLAKLFEMLAVAPIPAGASASFNLNWQQPDDAISDGDVFPNLTFTLRSPAIIQAINAQPSGTTVDDPPAAA